MKRWRAILFFGLTLALLGGVSLCVADGSNSPEQLRRSAETAFKSKNAEACASLIYWTGVTDRMKTQMKRNLKAIAKRGVIQVTLAPLPPDRPLTNELNGILYSPNVHVIGNLVVSHVKDEDDDSDSGAVYLPYGDHGGKYYISAVVEQLVTQTN